MSEITFITGNQAVVKGAVDAGAEFYFGYPITPATEILEGWVAEAEKNKNLHYLQTEDEISAGFGVIGAILAGKKAFTATAGVGNVLMQDPISMAENERLPFVEIVTQRGGPSTGTVIYSQQEVNLSTLGGNGDGLRIVYSASSVEECYSLTAKVFSTAWKYHFPSILLSDGYLAKEKTDIELFTSIKSFPAKKILKESTISPTHIRNCYGSEEEFSKVINRNISDYKLLLSKVSELETYKISDAKIAIIAHGSVAAAAKSAVINLRLSGKKVGLIRPITLRPLDSVSMKSLIKKFDKILVFESAFEQLSRIILNYIPESGKIMKKIFKPAVGFMPEEIENIVAKELNV